MKTTNYFFVILLFVLTSACKQQEDTITFHILQLNDVYEIAPIQGGKVGGMARVAGLYDSIQQHHDNTMLVMAGDFLNPSLLGTMKYQGEAVKGKQMVEVMNAMNFDLVAFGNHEFDLKEDELLQRLNESTFPWIASNIYHKVTDSTEVPFTIEKEGTQLPIPATYEVVFTNQKGDSVKVGFFTATLNSNPKPYVTYTNYLDAAQQSYSKLSKTNAIVLGLTHLSVKQDTEVAKALPNVPLLMGGHEHTNMAVPVGNTVITKADANAKTVYFHTLTYHVSTQQTTVTSQLLPVTEGTSTNEQVEGIVARWNALLDTKIKEILPNPNEVLFTTTEPLDGRDTPIRSTQTNLGELVARSMAFSFNDEVDCALVNGGSIRIDDELQGAITGVDFFRVLPYGGQILKVDLTGDLLAQVLAYGESKAGKGSYLQRYNATYNTETQQWLIQNKPILRDKKYTVAFSDYLLKGLDIPFLTPSTKGVFKVYENQPTDLSYDIRKAIIAYLHAQKEKA